MTVTTRMRVEGDTLHIKRTQDVEDIIEHNKELAKVRQKSDWGRHIATIPNVILEQWINDDGVNYLAPDFPADEFARVIRRKLADPQWAYLRTDNKAPTLHRGVKLQS